MKDSEKLAKWQWWLIGVVLLVLVTAGVWWYLPSHGNKSWELRLHGCRGCGVSWECVAADTDILQLRSSEIDDTTTKKSGVVGGSQDWVFVFGAGRPGETTVECRLAQPWEGGSEYEHRQYKVSVSSEREINAQELSSLAE